MGFPGRPPEQCALAFVPLFSFYSVYGKKLLSFGSGGGLTEACQVQLWQPATAVLGQY